MKISGSLKRLRSFIIYKFAYFANKVIKKILYSNSPFDIGDLTTARLSILADRIGLLESNINWRLYGLPSRVTNIKLEQAKLLAASGDVEWALEKLSIPGAFDASSLEKFFAKDSFHPQGKALLYLDTHLQEFHFFKQRLDDTLFLVDDTANLFRLEKNAFAIPEDEKVKVLRIDATSSAALLSVEKREFQFIWFSSLFERLTPLQTIILLGRAGKSLQNGGKCAGIFQDYQQTDPGLYWADPRRLRPVTKPFFAALFAAAELPNVEFYDLGQGRVLFLCNL